MENQDVPYVILLSKQPPRPITLVPSDPGSRYKCKQLQSQNVGKNKMMKTVLVNILDVAKEMQLPHPSYLVHFLGYELNVTPHFYEKQPPRQQAVLSGEHLPDTLSPLVQKFVNTFLLCSNCGLPELLHTVKGKKISARCRGCGSVQEIVPDNEKFHRYVINHPPAGKAENAFKGNNKVEKKDGSSPKRKERSAKEQQAEESDEDSDNVEWFSDVSEAAVQQRLKENVPELLLQEQSAAIDPKELQELLQKEDPATTCSLFKAQNGLSDVRYAELLFDALYLGKENTAGTLAKSFDAHKAVLSKALTDPTAQQAFLTKLEQFIDGKPLAKSLPALLQALYKLDLAGEDSILEWYNSCKNEALCQAAQPMIDWLNQEEESDSDE